MTANETPAPAAGVPGGVPASAFGSPVSDLIAADPPAARRSVMADVLDQALAVPQVHRTRVERWVEDSSFEGGHWEWVEDVV
jgi:hypothetical protein